MLSRVLANASRNAGNVAVLGAAGGIGQPLSLLLKANPAVKTLHLFDIAGTPGVAADLSHCDTPAQCKGFQGNEEAGACLKDMDIVIIPAGVPRKPGMTRDDLFTLTLPLLLHWLKLALNIVQMLGLVSLLTQSIQPFQLLLKFTRRKVFMMLAKCFV